MIDLARTTVELQARLQESTARAEGLEEGLRQPGDDWSENSENAVESAEDEVQEGGGDVTLDEIRWIKLALSRIASEKYWVCTKCAGRIPEKRLRAAPYATRCVKCS